MLGQPSRRIAAALAAVVCAGFAAANAPGQCNYEVSALILGPPCPPAGIPAALVGTGMNALGHVTGYFHDCHVSGHDHGFFWTPRTGRVTMHKPPGVWRVNPTDINDAGLIVGTMQITGVGGQGFVYDMHTQQYLAVLPPLHDGLPTLNIVSSINAINNSGIAVGARVISKPGVVPPVSNAVIWDTNTGEVIDLGVMNGPSSEARAVDSGGRVSGLTGFVTESNAFFAESRNPNDPLILPPLPQGTTSFVNDMNDIGMLAGGGIMDPKQVPGVQGQPAMWNGQWIGLGWLPGAYAGGARAINNLIQVGGSCTGADGQEAFLWQLGTMFNLNDLISGETIVLRRVFDLNDHGQILCDGGTRAVVLSPTDRPLADINADCVTDVHDLFMLLDAWGPCDKRLMCYADLNSDGVVDVSDLLILLANWDNPGRR
jgi:uncharacterized membrane protein